MAFDPKELEGLAATLLQKGLPILGGLIGGPVGAIAGNVVSGLVGTLAATLGLPADSPPAAVAAAVQADPQASNKLAALEDAQKTELAFAQLQVDQNNAELTIDKGAPWLNFFYGAWRPSAGWVFGPIPALYQLIASAFHLPLLADGIWAAFLPVWVGLAGLRTYERYTGVALDTLPVKPRGK